jgi:hypothetical protein
MTTVIPPSSDELPLGLNILPCNVMTIISINYALSVTVSSKTHCDATVMSKMYHKMARRQRHEQNAVHNELHLDE